MNQVGIIWAVLALITFLAGYYAQVINRLLDIRRDDKRRTTKYYRIRTLLSWMVVFLFVAVFMIAVKIWFLPPIYYHVVIGSFLVSQVIHVFVFGWSYWKDLFFRAKIHEGYWEDDTYIEPEI